MPPRLQDALEAADIELDDVRKRIGQDARTPAIKT